MGLLSLAIWLPVAVGTLLLALGRDEHAGAVRWTALIGAIAGLLVTLPLVLSLVHDMTGASDAELIRPMRYLVERMKIVVEPTGVLGVAGLFERGYEVRGKRVGVILSGGNVDPAMLKDWL